MRELASLIACLIASLTGFRRRIAWDTRQPNGQPRRQVDASRAAARFGVRAAADFAAGLTQTIAWRRRTQQEQEAARVAPARTVNHAADVFSTTRARGQC